MNIVYLVEMWSNKMMPDPFQPNEEECHYVHVAHIASSEKAARKWALENLEYGGMKRRHPEYFFPWHFRICQWKVDEDVGAVVHNHQVYLGKPIHPRKYHKKLKEVEWHTNT